MEESNPKSKIVALAGGVGGAKLAHGLQMALPPGALTVIVNSADDMKLWGLYISPDLDTVMYTLGNVANQETGWGVAGDTWRGMEMMTRYGREPWFRLGDMDMATHVLRTQMLGEGRTLTEATVDLVSALGIPSRIFPMCDEPVETMVETDDGILSFQDYFVRRRHADPVRGITFKGIEKSRPTSAVKDAIREADAIIFCPSNPFVSIGPILAVPGLRDALDASDAPKVAISPIVGGAALKGPAADMMQALGHEVNPVGVAALMQGLVDGMVIDRVDEQFAAPIRKMGMRVEVAQTVMKSNRDRESLARTTIQFCEQLVRSRTP